MSTTIPGDGKTFLNHVLHLNLDEVFHHDIPKVLGLAETESQILKDSWAKLEPNVQTALLHGTGIVNEIAADLNSPAASVVDSILAKFTDLKVEDLAPLLAKLQVELTSIDAIPNQDAATTIENLQKYIQSKVSTGSILGSILSRAAQALAVIINPTSVIGQIATYAETAYQIIKSLFNKS